MDHAGTRLAREGSGVRPALQRRGMLLTYIFGLETARIQRFPDFFRWLGWLTMSEAVVRMYSRRTCGLCDEARETILTVRARRSFEFEEVFVDGDESLERSYGLRVPVVEVNGAEMFEFAVEPAALEQMVVRAATT